MALWVSPLALLFYIMEPALFSEFGTLLNVLFGKPL